MWPLLDCGRRIIGVDGSVVERGGLDTRKGFRFRGLPRCDKAGVILPTYPRGGEPFATEGHFRLDQERVPERIAASANSPIRR